VPLAPQQTKMKSILTLGGLLILALSTVDAHPFRGKDRAPSPAPCLFEKQDGKKHATAKDVLDIPLRAITAVTITGNNPNYISANPNFYIASGKDVEYKVDCKNPDQSKTDLCQDVLVSENAGNGKGVCPRCVEESFTVRIGISSRYVGIYCAADIKHAKVCLSPTQTKETDCFQVIIGAGMKNNKTESGGTTNHRRKLLQGGQSGC